MKRFFAATAVAAGMLVAASAAAAPPAAPPPEPALRVVDITEVDVVDIERLEPDAMTLEWMAIRDRESLIRLRWRFDTELVRSADHL